MPARTQSVLDSLSTSIPKVFDQAQSSTANHQKNFVALNKLHVEAAGFTESVQKGIKLTGERTFEDYFIDMISRVLVIKKGTTVADRIVKFVGGYVKFIHAKAAEEREKKGEDDEDESTVSRFTSRLLKFLLRGFLAKDKNVRYRVVHFVAEMISHLGELEEEMYTLLRTSLMERVRDKESIIRVQAVIALSKLCGSDDPDDLEDDEPTAVEVLEDILAHDPSADVRRAALLNIPLSTATIPSLLARARDIDATVRKLVYSAVLEPNCFVPNTDDVVGVTHPRALTIAQRELIVRSGLGDREPAVRSAAGKLVGIWVDAVGGGKGTVIEDVLALLQTFDLAESTVAEEALLSVFVTRVDVFDALEFNDDFWTALNPEKAFLARVFVDHCISSKDDARLEPVLPVVTALAFRIQSGYNDLLEQIQMDDEDSFLRGADGDDEEHARKEEARMDREFVLGELLKLAVNLDYADEIGRRKMFQLVRDMISQEALPEHLVTRCLDVLRKLSPNERDLIRVVVEVVHELRDPRDSDEDEAKETELNGADDASTTFSETPMPARVARAPPAPKPISEMTPEEKARADALDLRCLDLCIGMLERVNGTFEENSTLEGILGELIVPAVKRKELALREKGLVSLGLCCLIARRMALNSFQLFLSQVQAAPEVLKIRVLQVIFDVLMVHEGDFLANGNVGGDRVIEFLLQVLNNEESDKVQAIIAMGFAKLMLSRMVTDNRVLSSLVLLYLSPDTAENQELRQCLSYFFPVYCYSSPANQRRMQQAFPSIFEQLAKAYKELDGDQDMVSPAQVGGMFVDWTDPQKAVEIQGQTADPSIHFDMATDIVKTLFGQAMERDEKKVLCQLLGKLHIPAEIDDDKVRTLKLLIHNLRSRRPVRDTTANNALARFDSAISKKFERQLEDFNEEEYRQLESLKDLFEFLDDIIPEDDDDDGDDDAENAMPPKRTSRKRRSGSVATTATETTSDEDRDRATTPLRKSGHRRTKRRRFDDPDDDDDDDDDVRELSPSTSVAPSRKMPRRAATRPVDMTPIHLEGDDDDDDDEATPVAPQRHRDAKTKTNGTAKKSAEEQRLDDEIDDLLDSASDAGPGDSVLGPNSGEEVEEEEDSEVEALLLDSDDA